MSHSPVVVLKSALWYYHNEDPYEQLAAAAGLTPQEFQAAHPRGDHWLEEKLQRYQEGMPHFLNVLDQQRFARWIDAALARFAAEATIYDV